MIFLCLILSFEHIFTIPSVKQLSTSDALFGVYPDKNVDVLWNPVFISNLNQYSLDFIRLKYVYDNFCAHRTLFPLMHKNKFSLGGVIFLAEENLYSPLRTLHEHNRGELFFGYNGCYGVSIFIDRKDWWYVPSYTTVGVDGWNTVLGGKLGVTFAKNNSLSMILSKENTASEYEFLTYLSHTSTKYGLTSLISFLPDLKVNFIGAYHITNLNMGKFIQSIKFEYREDELKYFIPLVLDLKVLEQLNLQGGSTMKITHPVAGMTHIENSISMGFMYKPFSSFKVVVNINNKPFDTSVWEIGFSYGN
ncbi:MAG: hypothetical protein PHX21_06310 [bacterium]|nr:hypothetical protein [bacterium]